MTERHIEIKLHDVSILIFAKCPDAWALYSVLLLEHQEKWRRGECDLFPISIDLFAKWNPPWNIKRLRKARDFLIGTGLICCLHKGGKGKGDASLHAFTSEP
jgi:hypothetical protein